MNPCLSREDLHGPSLYIIRRHYTRNANTQTHIYVVILSAPKPFVTPWHCLDLPLLHMLAWVKQLVREAPLRLLYRAPPHPVCCRLWQPLPHLYLLVSVPSMLGGLGTIPVRYSPLEWTERSPNLWGVSSRRPSPDAVRPKYGKAPVHENGPNLGKSYQN